MTFTAVTCLLITPNWWLGLITGAMFAPVLVFCTRFERRYKVLARRAQDQDGDLTTLVEEASAGVRVLKALGRDPMPTMRYSTSTTAHAAAAALPGSRSQPLPRLTADAASRRPLSPSYGESTPACTGTLWADTSPTPSPSGKLSRQASLAAMQSTPSAVTDVLASCTYSAVASIAGMASSFMKPPDWCCQRRA
jgi:ABC-type multidrug transport system fused ATPase/permease subunit